MSYPTYLVHFNKNHDRIGRFDTGDGDGDGQTEYRDRQNQKKNKYQYVDGSLTSKGKQRWASQYVKDVKRAKKKGQDTTKVQTSIETDKWIRQDVGKNIGSALWFLQVANYGGVWFRKRKSVYNEKTIDELLSTHSGDSIYSNKYNEGKKFSERLMFTPIWDKNPKITEKAFNIFREENGRNPDFNDTKDVKLFEYCLDDAGNTDKYYS